MYKYVQICMSISCYDAGGALAQFDDVRIACERRDAIYGKGSNTLEVTFSPCFYVYLHLPLPLH